MPVMPSDYTLGYDIKQDEIVYTAGPPLGEFAKEQTIGRLPWPFQPNDPTDYAVGTFVMLAPYPVLLLAGGPVAVARYSLVAPDMLMFSAGVAASNIGQLLAGLTFENQSDPVMDFYSYQYV